MCRKQFLQVTVKIIQKTESCAVIVFVRSKSQELTLRVFLAHPRSKFH